MKEEFSLEWILDKYSNLFSTINIHENVVQEKFIEYTNRHPNSHGKDFLWSLF